MVSGAGGFEKTTKTDFLINLLQTMAHPVQRRRGNGAFVSLWRSHG
ncbi:MAG: hypothetical protein ACPGPS_15090 [Rubripirellula sp.]